jgi:dipeptidyl aminopeptidase/acylaminoacyl peptidase
VYDIARRSWTPLSSERHNLAALWLWDGHRVTFTSAGELVTRAADASTAAVSLLARPRPQYGTSWSPDGQVLLFNDNEPDSDRYDIWILPEQGEPRPLIATEADEHGAQISPDGEVDGVSLGRIWAS